ncbi:hypothetical protein BDN71DRAFT_1509185 [Pleurotus eryngii]|uniref:Uncharacterized protein n=1 Tax=Pleurotus eryngii TaxID=5323 RepID=A0A9P5ZVW2_PLEER|nr:hypothetical protein BDN71DRAFT_1509185 [Pleurotus eryngii]
MGAEFRSYNALHVPLFLHRQRLARLTTPRSTPTPFRNRDTAASRLDGVPIRTTSTTTTGEEELQRGNRLVEPRRQPEDNEDESALAGAGAGPERVHQGRRREQKASGGREGKSESGIREKAPALFLSEYQLNIRLHDDNSNAPQSTPSRVNLIHDRHHHTSLTISQDTQPMRQLSHQGEVGTAILTEPNCLAPQSVSPSVHRIPTSLTPTKTPLPWVLPPQHSQQMDRSPHARTRSSAPATMVSRETPGPPHRISTFRNPGQAATTYNGK